MSRKCKIKHLVGQRFGMLEVLRYVRRTEYRDHVWECKCDCGNIVNRNQSNLLKTDKIHSCGCYNQQYLKAGNAESCRKAGIARAQKRNINGINVDMLDNSKNISTNTSGHKGISWSKSAHKWHVYVGYKSYRCNLGYVEHFDDAVNLRELACKHIEEGTFEDFFYELRGFRIEEKLQQIKKETKGERRLATDGQIQLR